MTLDLPAVQAILDRVTYRPGWTLTARAGFTTPIHLTINCTVDDSYHPGQTVTLDIHVHMPPLADAEQLLRWLHWRLRMVELHEADEWFKLDGAPVFDPHAEHADRDEGNITNAAVRA